MIKSLILLFFSMNYLYAQTFVYECAQKKQFVIQLEEEKAWLLTRVDSLSLDLNKTASQAQYVAEGYQFVQDGYEASLKTPSEVYANCSNNRYKAIWEDAKLRGNDFRAIGNEPGWYLEIAEKGAKSLLVTDYGKERYELSLPRPHSSSQTRTTRYRIKGFLDITLVGKRCQDSMTGLWYPTRVRIELDGKTYRGCGKALH